MDQARDRTLRKIATRGKDQRTAIGQEDLKKAIAKYLNSGGQIEKLPEQKAVTHSRAGRSWGVREFELDPLK